MSELHLEGSRVSPVAVAEEHGDSLADTMKDLRRRRLRRQAATDLSLAKDLIRLESSPVYNASGELIPVVSGSLDGDV